MRTIVFSGEPNSTQHIYGLAVRGCIPHRYMTTAGKILKQAYQLEAKAQWKGKPLSGDIEVSITLYFGTKRKADLDNFNKLSLDASLASPTTMTARIAKLTIERGYDTAACGDFIGIAVNAPRESADASIRARNSVWLVPLSPRDNRTNGVPMTDQSKDNDQGLDNKVQNEGSKPDVLKERLAGRDQDKMILDKIDEVNKKKGEGSDTIKEVTSNSIISP